MKYVIGVVRASNLERVRRALGRAGIYRLTVGEVEAFDVGREIPPGEEARRIRLEIAVNDTFLSSALEAFKTECDDDEDAWVSVLALEDVMRIRTGETGPEAI